MCAAPGVNLRRFGRQRRVSDSMSARAWRTILVCRVKGPRVAILAPWEGSQGALPRVGNSAHSFVLPFSFVWVKEPTKEENGLCGNHEHHVRFLFFVRLVQVSPAS